MILLALEKDDEIYGTNNIARLLLSKNKTWIIKQLRDLEQQDLLEIVRNGPGRGRKNIIRRNRNSPGYPRKAGQ